MSEHEESVEAGTPDIAPVESSDVMVLAAEDLALINEAKMNAILVTTQAEKAAAQARIADLEYHAIVQQIYLKYDLKPTVHKIDYKSGLIMKIEKDNK